MFALASHLEAELFLTLHSTPFFVCFFLPPPFSKQTSLAVLFSRRRHIQHTYIAFDPISSLSIFFSLHLISPSFALHFAKAQLQPQPRRRSLLVFIDSPTQTILTPRHGQFSKKGHRAVIALQLTPSKPADNPRPSPAALQRRKAQHNAFISPRRVLTALTAL